MALKLDEISIRQINNLKQATEYFSVTIEKAVEPEKLKALNDVLKISGDRCKVVLVVDLKKKAALGFVRNLEVLNSICDVKHLAILSNSSEPIETIEQLSDIVDLKELSLSGFFAKNISLEPIEKFNNLNFLSFEAGLNRRQSKTLNSFRHLLKLSVQSIDLKDFLKNESLESLRITKNLKNHQLLVSLFPNLKQLYLAHCKTIDNCDFINELICLERLSLNCMKQLTEFPKLDLLKKLSEIELLEAKSIQSISNILIHKNLEKLSITDANNLQIQDFERLAELKDLRVVYTRFSDGVKAGAFNSLAIEHCWIINKKTLCD